MRLVRIRQIRAEKAIANAVLAIGIVLAIACVVAAAVSRMA